MTESGKHGRLLWAAAGVIILCTLISRSAAVLYSFAATDILYAEGVLPDLLTFLRQFFAAAAFGAGIASVTAAAVRGGGRLTAAAAGIHIAVLLADALAAFLIDALSGAVRAALLPAAALMNQFGSLDALLEGWPEIPKPSVRESVRKNADRIRKNYALICLEGSQELPFPWEELKTTIPNVTTMQVLHSLEIL